MSADKSDNQTSLPLSGMVALLALLSSTSGKLDQLLRNPTLIENMISELRHSPRKQPVDDEAIETLLLLQRYLYLAENALKQE